MVSGARVPVGPSLGFSLALCLNLRPSVFLFSVSPLSVSPIPSVCYHVVSLFIELCLSVYIPLRLSLLFSPSFCFPRPFSLPESLSLPTSKPPLLFFPLALSLSVSLHLSLPFPVSLPLYPHLSLLLSLSLSLSSPSPRLYLSQTLPLAPPRPPAAPTPRPVCCSLLAHG